MRFRKRLQVIPRIGASSSRQWLGDCTCKLVHLNLHGHALHCASCHDEHSLQIPNSCFLFLLQAMPRLHVHVVAGCTRQNQPGRPRAGVCRSSRGFVLYDLHDKQVPYHIAWVWQKARAKQVAEGNQPQALVLLQHPPVYTLGTYSKLDNLNFSVTNPPFPLFRTERGGEVTYHGPGQLVAYPIIDLRQHGQDLHQYLRKLESVIITALMEVSGIQAFREEGLTGVWTESGKIAATGIRATRWITYHGIALNVSTDLSPFDNIIPCGIQGRSVASVCSHLESCGLAPQLDGHTGQHDVPLLTEYSIAIAESFEEEFSLHMSRTEHELV